MLELTFDRFFRFFHEGLELQIYIAQNHFEKQRNDLVNVETDLIEYFIYFNSQLTLIKYIYYGVSFRQFSIREICAGVNDY